MNPTLQDSLLQASIALPTGASSVYTPGIQLHDAALQDFVALVELLIEAPGLTTGQLNDTHTVTYTIEHDNDPAFGTTSTLSIALVQTGAGGAGAVATTLRFRPPTNVKQYVRCKATTSNADNASASSVTLALVF